MNETFIRDPTDIEVMFIEPSLIDLAGSSIGACTTDGELNLNQGFELTP
jgi:hypothetical protein